MANEAVVFFESRLTAEQLPIVPERLVNECPAFLRLFNSWGWPLAASRFVWVPTFDEGGFRHYTAAEALAKRRAVTLFGSGGHFSFGPGWLAWANEVKWSWVFDGPEERAGLIEVSAQLAKLVRSDVGLVTGDFGPDGDVLDVLEAGGTVRDAIAAVSRGGEVMPLQTLPFVAPGVYPRPSYGVFFLLRFA